METTKVFLGVTGHHFSLTNFSQCQNVGGLGDWFSDPFYSHAGGYRLKLNVETNQILRPVMRVCLCPVETEHVLDWPVTFVVTLQLLNQLGDHTHYLRELNIRLESANTGYSNPHEYIAFETLYRRDKEVHILCKTP